jgi:hypothetical protein
MTNLTDVPEKQLLAELERRKKQIPAIPAPRSVSNISLVDLEKIRKLAIDNIDRLTTEGIEIKDVEHWFYEIGMEAIYGEDIWVAIKPFSR